MYIHIKGQPGPLVTLTNCNQERAHIAGYAGNPLETRFFIENRIKLVGGVALLPQQVDENVGVNRARAAPHHQPLQRGKAHGGIYNATATYCSQRATIAYMARNQPQRLQVSSQELCM